MCFCLGIQDVLDSAISAGKKSFLLNHISMVESGDTLARSGVLLKICLYTNSKHHCTIRYSGKYLRIFLGFSFVVFACIVRKWCHSFYFLSNCEAGIYSGLINWDVLLNDLYTRSCTYSKFILYPKTTEFLGEENCSFFCWNDLRIKTVSCENNLYIQSRSANVHNIVTWQKSSTFFTKHISVATSETVTILVFTFVKRCCVLRER